MGVEFITVWLIIFLLVFYKPDNYLNKPGKQNSSRDKFFIDCRHLSQNIRKSKSTEELEQVWKSEIIKLRCYRSKIDIKIFRYPMEQIWCEYYIKKSEHDRKG